MPVPLGRFGRFLGVGVVNTAVGLLVIYACKGFFGVGDIAANAIGYGVGMTLSFVLNSRWTFAFTGQQWPAFARFIAVSLAAYLSNLAAVLVAIRAVGIDSYLAHALGIPVYTTCVYLASKYLVFRAEPAAAQGP